jgi:hypothetical protein
LRFIGDTERVALTLSVGYLLHVHLLSDPSTARQCEACYERELTRALD